MVTTAVAVVATAGPVRGVTSFLCAGMYIKQTNKHTRSTCTYSRIKMLSLKCLMEMRCAYSEGNIHVVQKCTCPRIRSKSLRVLRCSFSVYSIMGCKCTSCDGAGRFHELL